MRRSGDISCHFPAIGWSEISRDSSTSLGMTKRLRAPGSWLERLVRCGCGELTVSAELRTTWVCCRSLNTCAVAPGTRDHRRCGRRRRLRADSDRRCGSIEPERRWASRRSRRTGKTWSCARECRAEPLRRLRARSTPSALRSPLIRKAILVRRSRGEFWRCARKSK